MSSGRGHRESKGCQGTSSFSSIRLIAWDGMCMMNTPDDGRAVGPNSQCCPSPADSAPLKTLNKSPSARGPPGTASTPSGKDDLVSPSSWVAATPGVEGSAPFQRKDTRQTDPASRFSSVKSQPALPSQEIVAGESPSCSLSLLYHLQVQENSP